MSAVSSTHSKFDEVSSEEIIAALGDPVKFEALLAQVGATREDLMAYAESLAKDLAESVSSISMV